MNPQLTMAISLKASPGRLLSNNTHESLGNNYDVLTGNNDAHKKHDDRGDGGYNDHTIFVDCGKLGRFSRDHDSVMPARHAYQET